MTFDARAEASKLVALLRGSVGTDFDTPEDWVDAVCALVQRAGLSRSTPGTADGEAHACKCKNGPCPVCGDGPSGEWCEGAEVTCDGCGLNLMVDVVEECGGRSLFSLANNPCPDCKGEGVVGGDDNATDCVPCDGNGWRELTVEEARKVAGLAATPVTPSPVPTPGIFVTCLACHGAGAKMNGEGMTASFLRCSECNGAGSISDPCGCTDPRSGHAPSPPHRCWVKGCKCQTFVPFHDTLGTNQPSPASTPTGDASR